MWCVKAAHVQPVVVVVQVSRATDASGKGALQTSIPLNESPYIISELAVPLTPDIPVREAADLVQTPTVPGLCYQLHLQSWRLAVAYRLMCVTHLDTRLCFHL